MLFYNKKRKLFGKALVFKKKNNMYFIMKIKIWKKKVDTLNSKQQIRRSPDNYLVRRGNIRNQKILIMFIFFLNYVKKKNHSYLPLVHFLRATLRFYFR